MYTEELEGFEGTEREQRTYVSGSSQPADTEKLLRENEKLRKGLEKEKFFNKLLDQEIKELKSESAARGPAELESRGTVSKGAFNFLLIVALALAGFLIYTLYYNKQYNLFGGSADSNTITVSDEEAVDDSEVDPSGNNGSGQTGSEGITQDATAPPPATATGRPRSDLEVGRTAAPSTNTSPASPDASAPATNQADRTASTPASSQADRSASGEGRTPRERDAAPAATGNRETPGTDGGTAPGAAGRTETSTSSNQRERPDSGNARTTPPPAEGTGEPAAPSRPVIAKYNVTSKANFYNAPDENTLRSAFISAGGSVDALEDKGGFIYVEYRNERGMMNKGWLSKADLTKAE